ncbi:glycosyl transferase, group 2 [Thermosulfidibacter takaii ABI70S6]|uniref:Glycosyl transferase, group 2 n=1 Tax=Thermosulfidibacter takaii (strain DSM 17441 / JCM 13301 / NBRC 103674 / ABI70S6) TaxID=1298851 RepID=A0A0S3QRZ3_THET7|nr:glycosyltransferase family 2 protein [Thermosulfidibacter takaii]BAT71069.1 glycosyl transferase, group 2 [Thermosulfidibacter takaii ABI70S6]
MNPKIYIIILNYNSWADTIECLESVLRNDYPNYQVVVVDNNSINNSMEYIKAWTEGKIDVWVKSDHPLRHLSFPPVEKTIPYVYYTREEAEKGGNPELEKKLMGNIPESVSTKYPLVFIQTGHNGGFAFGNNVGIKYALARDDFEYIWLLNNDTVIERNSLSSLVCYASENDLGISGSVLMYYDVPRKVQAYGGTTNKFLGIVKHIKSINDIEKKLDHIVGASFLINKKVIQKIGLLPEEYFLYLEETDYCFNARNHGFKLGIAIDSVVYHKEGSSIGSSSKDNNNKSEFADLLFIRNRIKFHKKYLGGGIGLHFGLMITIANRIKRKQFKRACKIFKMMTDRKGH